MLIVLDWCVLGASESWQWLSVCNRDLVVGLLQELLDLGKLLVGGSMRFVVVTGIELDSVDVW